MTRAPGKNEIFFSGTQICFVEAFFVRKTVTKFCYGFFTLRSLWEKVVFCQALELFNFFEPLFSQLQNKFLQTFK
jgi:hypothetical protein